MRAAALPRAQENGKMGARRNMQRLQRHLRAPEGVAQRTKGRHTVGKVPLDESKWARVPKYVCVYCNSDRRPPTIWYVFTSPLSLVP